jgi:HlyD family secretion protein
MNPFSMLVTKFSKKDKNLGEKPEKSLKVKKPPMSKRKKKKLIRWIAIGAIVAAVALFLIFRPGGQIQDNLVSRVDMTELLISDIEYTISGSGRVESNRSHKVYASQSYVIEEVLVEVGDVVAVGQVLVALDTTTLEDQIESREVSMAVTEMSAAQQIKAASDTYLAAQRAIQNGTNASIISADSSVRTAFENLERAKKTYDDALRAKQNGTNSSLLAQDTQVSTAQKALEDANNALNSANESRDNAKTRLDEHVPSLPDKTAAQTAYDAAVAAQNNRQSAYNLALAGYNAAEILFLADNNQNQTITDAFNNARTTLETAEKSLSDAMAMTNSAKAILDSAHSSTDMRGMELQADYNAKNAAADAARTVRDQAQTAYDNAVSSRNAAYVTFDTTLADYLKNIDSTLAAYETALLSQTATQKSVQDSLQQSRNSLASAQIGANTDLADLEYERMLNNLSDANVSAEHAGTITAVFASVGSVASGILFVIEDTGDLIIETTISEYDVGTIKEGMAVAIRSEATGDAVYDGTVISVAPTSNKNAMGDTDRMGDALFATKIKVTSADTDLKIGMTTRINFIVEREENVLAVPYDAVYVNDDGQECIMVLEGDLLTEVLVETGLENDFSIVVSGKNIKEGITIIKTPSNYKELIGRTIILTDQMINIGNNQFGGMMFR